jgi:hypothetical protein
LLLNAKDQVSLSVPQAVSKQGGGPPHLCVSFLSSELLRSVFTQKILFIPCPKLARKEYCTQNNDQINDFSNLDFKSWISHVNLPNRSGLTRCSMITLSSFVLIYLNRLHNNKEILLIPVLNKFLRVILSYSKEKISHSKKLNRVLPG